MTEAATLLTAWKAAQARLKAGRIDSPSIDARLLLEAATGASRTDILTDPYRPVAADQVSVLDAYVERRLRREPVSRILGKKGFWKIMLNVTPDVLSPRADTEAILDVVLLHYPPHQAFTMADLGTGSGAILLAALAERSGARGVGTDVSSEALGLPAHGMGDRLRRRQLRPGGFQSALHPVRRHRGAGPGGARPRSAPGAGRRR